MPNILATSFIVFLLTACNLQQPIYTQSAPPTITPNNGAVSDWEIIAEGLEWRTLIPDGNTLAQMSVLRIDYQKYRFRAIYQQGVPLHLHNWINVLPDATAIINANFFTRDHTALGIIVSDGVRYGDIFRNTGGMFIIKDGIPILRTNHSYDGNTQSVEQAVEGFPLLVENGQSVHYSNNQTRPTRRTIIAQDIDGHILFFVAPFLGLSLTELSNYLANTDLNIVTALNLDGGGSSMMRVKPNDLTIPSFDPVPVVLAIYPIDE